MDITFFEIHLDGAQFGPKTIGDEMMGKMDEMSEMSEMRKRGKRGGMDESSEMDGATTDEWESGERSRPPLGFVPVFLAVGLAAGYLAYRRFRGEAEEIDVDAEPVEIEA